MGMKINELNVDTAYSPIVEKALFEDIVLIPGVTYTDKFTEVAGKLYVHKETSKPRTPTKVGSKFTGEDASDDLVEITVDQEFNFDKNLYGVQLNTVKYDAVASQMDTGAKEVAVAKQAVGLATMAKEGTDFGTYTAISASNVRNTITQIRKKLKDNKAGMDFLIVNTNVYACMLEDKNAFAPSLNDEQLRLGIVGKYLGAPVLEANALQGTIQPYGWTSAYDLSKVEVIAGKSDALAIHEVLNMLRTITAQDFFGLRCQGQVDAGFKVVNPKKLVIKFNSQPANTASASEE